MKKNKGFTLVELLAVIVVLALIIVLVVPAVIKVMNDAKKKSFFLEAQSLQSKAMAAYTSTSDSEIDTQTCTVYDIKTDLDISNTGNYDGWVKISREAVNESGEDKVSVDLSYSGGIKYARYCIAKQGETCTPNTSQPFLAGSTKVRISKLLTKDYRICANYQYENNGKLKTSSTTCENAREATTTGYKTNVYMVLTNKTFTFSGQFNEDQFSEEEFAKRLVQADGRGISLTACDGVTNLTKGEYVDETQTIKTTTTTVKDGCGILEDDKKNFTIYFNSMGGTNIESINQCVDCDYNTALNEPNKNGYTFLGWYYDKEFKHAVENINSSQIKKAPDYNTQGCLIGFKNVTLYAKWAQGEIETTTSPLYYVATTKPTDPLEIGVSTSVITSQTTEMPTTTIDVSDVSLLLNSLNIQGQSIDFSPVKFYYKLRVKNEVGDLNVSADPYDPTTKVTITGNKSLKVGKNNLQVKLTNEKGKISTYLVVVDRLNEAGASVEEEITSQVAPGGVPDPSLPQSNANLRSVNISGYLFDFKPDVYKYDLDIYEPGKLTIMAIPQYSGAIVTITGADNVKDNSEILISVKSQNGYYTKTYSIKTHEVKTESVAKKILKGIIIALIVVLVLCAIIIKLSKEGKIKFGRHKAEDQAGEGEGANYQEASQVDANGVPSNDVSDNTTPPQDNPPM